MRINKGMVICVLVFAFAFVMAQNVPAAAGEKIVLRFSSTLNTAHPHNRAINEYFRDELKRLTNDRFDVQVFDNAQLGGERDLMEQLQAGMLQMCSLSPVLGAIEPAIAIFDLPYLFLDDKHMDEVLDGPIGKAIMKDLPAKGLVNLGYFENGLRVTTNVVRPIKNLADMKGLKIRTPEVQVAVAIFNAFGANVTTISFAELYSALQQRVVDGQENAYNTIATSRYFEVQKYISETNHQLGVHSLVANAKWLNSLEPAMRDAVLKAAAGASVYQRKIFRELTAGSKKTCIDAGMEVYSPDLAEFREAVKPIYVDFMAKFPQYREIVEQIRALRK